MKNCGDLRNWRNHQPAKSLIIGGACRGRTYDLRIKSLKEDAILSIS